MVGFVLTACIELGYCYGCFIMADYLTFEWARLCPPQISISGCFGFEVWLAPSLCSYFACPWSLLFSGACFVLPQARFTIFSRHNKIRDLTANLLTGVCPQVCVESVLQLVYNLDEFPLATSNTKEEVCLNIAVNEFWEGHLERWLVDFHVFNPFTSSNSSTSLSSPFKKHKNIKHHVYGQHVWEIEHASFTPIVLAATGG